MIKLNDIIWKLQLWGTIIALITVPCAGLYIIQSQVCSELKIIMQNPTHYNIWTGCQMGANEESGDLVGTVKGDK